ncbi:LytR/AlgR family response regulator transcription factor [endosymbiont of unidentified scaly snail isolate Monju]|uniref:LytR/AlgR family response regulator transcription factor n=1 Tax=endosymbiont of unidentified scaly snail isolate Monju TaxID=1248727 RepID=UPI0003892893|nr:LytTR family DNA-binding domain-containing protein [endosymbiont of unidentified scaly snail isolate Monju]BAN68078.1 two-component system, LytT family, response regulator AlgR [endosymbiont of unidentified scaly snail isolate Monju]
MKLLIADDEAPARARLHELLREVRPDAELVGEAADGETALALAREHRPDVALLDIRMPGMDGIRAALAMQELETPPAVIFVTAFDEHALAAFEANAIDYLLKPVRASRLRTALDKAAVFTRSQREALAQADNTPGLSVTQRGVTRRIPLHDILCLKADHKYVEVHHRDGVALSDASLKSIEEQFPGRFLRIHRNALVDPARARELRRAPDGRALLTIEGLALPLEVSRRHLPRVRALLRG